MVATIGSICRISSRNGKGNQHNLCSAKRWCCQFQMWSWKKDSQQLGKLFLGLPLLWKNSSVSLIELINFYKMEQSYTKSMLTVLSLIMETLIADEFLKHYDTDIKVGMASRASEIIRVTALVAPYNGKRMKQVFN